MTGKHRAPVHGPFARGHRPGGAPATRHGMAGVVAGAALVLSSCVSSPDTPASSASGSAAGGAGAGQAAAGGSASSCATTTPVRVSVAPQIVDVVRSVATQLRSAGGCADYQVTGAAPVIAAQGITTGTDLPALWIPDSPIYADQVNKAKAGTVVASGAPIASSPIAFAVPKALSSFGDGSRPWLQIVGSVGDKLRVAKPDQSTTSAVMLLAAWTGTASNTAGQKALTNAVIPLSRTASTDAALLQGAAGAAKDAAVFPLSEQAMAAFNKDHPNAPLSALVPSEGVGALQFTPFTTSSTKEVSNEVTQLLAALRGDSGQAALTEAGMRVGDGAGPGVPGMPAQPKVVVRPTPGLVDLTMSTWASMSRDLRLLTVIDASGSMKYKTANGMTRIDAATKSAGEAMGQVPPGTRVGLWLFAENRGGPGQDWKQLAPVAPVSAKEGSTTHGENVLRAFGSIRSQVGGGTGLYDTIWAAYDQAVRTYDPKLANVVIVLTDGKNEDPKTIGLPALLTKVKAATTPQRPVKLILIGIGAEADLGVLRQIAGAAGGAAFNGDKGATVRDVLVDALVPVRPEGVRPAS